MRSHASALEHQPPAVAEELRVSDLWKGFHSRAGKRIEVLRGVSFSVSAGEVVAITGPSGAGKSTLLHVLGGLEAPDRGTMQLAQVGSRARESQPAGSRSAESIRSPLQLEGRVGFVFQFHHLLPDLNAFENVALPLMIARFSRAESERRAALCLEEMGLGQRLSQRIGDLSGGEQQRVAVARALIGKPRLVLADEPTGNLDASIGDEIGQLLVDYCRQQQAIVVIATHNERLTQLCDRALLLREGRLMSDKL
jgi:lipoprotein-releasing system ATP-binding protein